MKFISINFVRCGRAIVRRSADAFRMCHSHFGSDGNRFDAIRGNSCDWILLRNRFSHADAFEAMTNVQLLRRFEKNRVDGGSACCVTIFMLRKRISHQFANTCTKALVGAEYEIRFNDHRLTDEQTGYFRRSLNPFWFIFSQRPATKYPPLLVRPLHWHGERAARIFRNIQQQKMHVQQTRIRMWYSHCEHWQNRYINWITAAASLPHFPSDGAMVYCLPQIATTKPHTHDNLAVLANSRTHTRPHDEYVVQLTTRNCFSVRTKQQCE